MALSIQQAGEQAARAFPLDFRVVRGAPAVGMAGRSSPLPMASRAYGIPLVAAGSSEGKNEVCARNAWTGAGINLHTEIPTPLQVRKAVKKVIADPRYKQRAKTIQADYARHDTPGEAVELLEKLAIT